MASRLETAVKSFRNEILQAESKATIATVKEYAKVRGELVKQINELTSAIASSGRDFTAGEIVRFERAQALLAQVEARMTELSRGTLTIIETGQDAAVVLGQEHTQGMALVGTMDNARATAQVTASWNHLNTGAVESMVGRLSNGTPLNRYLETVAPDTSGRISDALVRAIAIGENPRATAARLAKELDVSAAKLLMTCRDSVMDSYRDASLASMAENADILKGWTWVCALDNSCATCVALHGQEFPITEQFFASHNSCRCSPAPLVDGVDNPIAKDAGEKYFNGLPEKQQDAILGKQAGIAYRDGAVQLTDFVQLNKNETWGDSYVQGSYAFAQASAIDRGVAASRFDELPKAERVSASSGGAATEEAA